MQASVDKHSFCVISEGGRALGTGFSFLRPDWIVTAKHVVFEHGLPRTRLILHGLGSAPRAARVIAASPEVDLAILTINEPRPNDRPMLPGHESLSAQKEVMWLGYSPSKSNLATGDLAIIVGQASVVERVERERSAIEVVLELGTDEVERGCSGGPVIADGGAVVGVIIEKCLGDGAARARATSIATLWDSLKIGVPDSWVVGS